MKAVLQRSCSICLLFLDALLDLIHLQVVAFFQRLSWQVLGHPSTSPFNDSFIGSLGNENASKGPTLSFPQYESKLTVCDNETQYEYKLTVCDGETRISQPALYLGPWQLEKEGKRGGEVEKKGRLQA